MNYSTKTAKRWTANKFGQETFKKASQQNTAFEGNADDKTLQIVEKLRRACNASMARCIASQKRVPKFGGTLKSEDAAKPATRPDDAVSETETNQCMSSSEEYNEAIIKSESEHFKRLLKEMDTSPWGGVFRT